MSAISLAGVSKSYESSGGRLDVLRGVDLEIGAGEFAVLLGPSGSGKSTLLHLMGGLDRADSGRVRVGEKDLTALSDRELARFRNVDVGIIFQFFNLFSSLSVLDNVCLPGILRGDSQEDSKRSARALLERVGLKRAAAQKANELSGGEMQRVAICRALLLRPPLLLADEPTGNLDSKNGAEVLRLLTELASENRSTIVMVTHDESLARSANRVIRLKDGRVTP